MPTRTRTSRSAGNAWSRTRAAATAHLLGRLVRAVLAAAALAALLGAVPWALAHYIGWPLPRHWPTTADWHTFLTTPLSDRALLDALACACWTAWAAFATDVARAIPEAARDAHTTVSFTRPPAGPAHALAAVLVGALLGAALQHRPPSGIALRPAFAVTYLEHPAQPTTSAAAAGGIGSPVTVVVEEPRGGVHDSLWRIAARTLGDGNRWPEIWALNGNTHQAGGEMFTDPGEIRPGWVLRLPRNAAPPSSNAEPVPPAAPSPPANPQRPTRSPPLPAVPRPVAQPDTPLATPNRPRPAQTNSTPADTATARSRRSSFTTVSDDELVAVSLGLAAAVSAALVASRWRQRRVYQPGSGRRDDLPVAPVIRTLHIAHLRATDHARASDPFQNRATPQVIALRTEPEGDLRRDDVDENKPRGFTTASADVALSLAFHGGLGLVGPGAPSAARALIVEALAGTAAKSDRATVLFTQQAARALFDSDLRESTTVADLRLADDASAALSQLESAAATHDEHGPSRRANTRTLLVIDGPVDADAERLRAVLTAAPFASNGAIVLGQWRPGATCLVDAAGTVTATSPGPAESLRAHPMGRLTAAHALTIATALAESAPRPPAPDRARDFALGVPGAGGDTGPHTGSAPVSRFTHHENNPVAVHADERQAIPDLESQHGASGRTQTAVLERAARDEIGPPLKLRLLGPIGLTYRAEDNTELEIIEVITRRQRELLAVLANHPAGIDREQLGEALWPDGPARRPLNALNTALSRLRTNISTATGGAIAEITISRGPTLLLDSKVVSTDVGHLRQKLAVARSGNEQERAQAVANISDWYRGELAEGLTAECLEIPREATRRDALDAICALARERIELDPEWSLSLFERARDIDPYNEATYQEIIRVQRKLGRTDAIRRTIKLLDSQLAEIDAQPTATTRALAFP